MKVKSRLQAKPGTLRKVTVLVSVATIENRRPHQAMLRSPEHVVGGALLLAADPQAEGDDAREVDGEDGEVEEEAWPTAPSAQRRVIWLLDDLEGRGEAADLVVPGLLGEGVVLGRHLGPHVAERLLELELEARGARRAGSP